MTANKENTTGEQNLHTWAGFLRQQFIEAYGEMEFARRLLEFDKLIPDGIPDRRGYMLEMFTTDTAFKAFHLAVVWLDRIGYGDLLVSELFEEILQVMGKG
jgi:hypothetical protein